MGNGMNTGLENSVVLVTSPNKDNVIGTGFAIHREQDQTYLVTCAHVVKDLGGKDSILVNGIHSKVLALGNVNGFDLALLEVEGLSNLPLLQPLTLSGEEQRTIKIVGYYLYSENNQHSCKTLEGICYKTGDVVQQIEKLLERAAVLELQMSQEHKLKAGYSGSPVVDQETGYVLGVVTHLEEDGQIGRAICIEALSKLKSFEEIPSLPLLLKYHMTSQSNSEKNTPNFNPSIRLLSNPRFQETKVREELKKLPGWVQAIIAFIFIVFGVASWNYIQANPNQSIPAMQYLRNSKYKRRGVTVINRETSQPIEKVTVQIIFDGPPVQKMTNRSGYFEISIPVRETVEVILTKQGFKTARESIGLEVDPDNTILLYLDPDH